ncbi:MULTISPECIES: tRNA (adenosine(37)-N6)-threonylcarbamoyltransferase complex ATPase subunit type 1 TsaE [unclassified Ruegeria]|uniref:tRNA (adenosine(37)-N6)-threonylcarbamoyltransferase complex ATPase subunit type 1 TsaE n=1 Tax=unclassified Ruegeria TaxID=2625375 RepID=UPI00148769AD|nr:MULTISPECIES: tRNA (adenosine(37)-N6)-threonylcarbamoyltransferase complex ATPase subunit type 1 TsaE [unclassified Ruegeria]
MTTAPLTIDLNSPEETAGFAARLGSKLLPGDIVLLEGEIGSGKTHFARSLIQSLMTIPEDVPSPTFTLVQVYDTAAAEIWHCDLYRLSAVEEVEELGLTEAFYTSICLIEWPAKLGPLRPENALTLTFETDPNMMEKRMLTLTWSDPRWSEKLESCS